MCTAIAQPKGTETLSIAILETGWNANPDGGGYAFIDPNNTIQQRHFMEMDDFILNYLQDHEDNGATSPFVLHVRIATHGSVTLENCHPFDVPLQGAGDMVMAHNGIISKMGPYVKDTDLTDTEGLIKYVLCDLVDAWLDSTLMTDLMEDAIDSSKLVFLTTSEDLNSNLYILNEELGIWEDEVWYSNYSCFTYESKVVYGGYDNYGSNYEWWDKDAAAESSSKRYTVIKDGKYTEGMASEDTASIDNFGTWLIHADDRRETATALANATPDEHVTMFNNSLAMEDACAVCTGIKRCICDDICHDCYEAYHDCDCMGSFISLDDSFTDGWVERVSAIAGSGLAANCDTLADPF